MPQRRRDNPSLLDVWSELLKTMPAWVGPAVAVSAFLFLRYAAPLIFPVPKAGFSVGSVVSPMLPLFAWVIGLGLMVAWIGAETHKWTGRTRLDRQAGIGTVRGLSWQDFEGLVAEAYRRRGYTARVVGSPDGDGGVDVELTRQGEVVLVQCKHWRAWSVGVPVARELLGVVVHRRATRGILVTSGRFTQEALAFSDGNSQIQLVDGTRLAAMIEEVRRGREVATRTEPMSPTHASSTSSSPSSTTRTTTPPACPVCGTGMVMRTARHGKNAGSQFWGCPKYPGCRGTRTAV